MFVESPPAMKQFLLTLAGSPGQEHTSQQLCDALDLTPAQLAGVRPWKRLRIGSPGCSLSVWRRCGTNKDWIRQPTGARMIPGRPFSQPEGFIYSDPPPDMRFLGSGLALLFGDSG
jgi:hypothetical protein